MSNRPLVTVRCLVYNHEPYLRQCLDGFVMQKTDFPFEAIVHDDASTDNSAAIIREYAEKYPDIIKPIYESENQYRKGTIGKIMDNAISPFSKYIAICEGDDYWTDPYKLQKQVDALEAHPECSICFAKVATITSDGNLQRRIHPSFSIPTIFELSDFVKWEFGDSGWVFHTSCFLYRKNVILDYNEALNTKFKGFPHGDLIIQLHCLHHGKGYYIPDFVSCYRTLSGGYNSYVMNHVEFAINENNKKIQGLKNYDNCTNFQFHSILKKAMLSIELKNAKLTKKCFAPFDCKYFYLYKQSSFKDVTCFFLDYYFPNLLRLLVTIKHIILK